MLLAPTFVVAMVAVISNASTGHCA